MNICLRKMVALIFVFCLLMGSYCGNFSAPAQETHQKQDEKIMCNEYSGANLEICEALKESPSCQTIKDCESIAISLLPKAPSPHSDGQRILVIDHGMNLPAYTRYKSRVLDYLAHNEKGIYQSVTEKIQLPKVVFRILSGILDEKYSDLPAKELDPISGLYASRTKAVYSLTGYGLWRHGTPIFSTLADHNPSSEFILADLFVDPKDDFCAFSEDPKAQDRLKNFLVNAANSLIVAIRKYDINFVNMSFGDSEEIFRDKWNNNCHPSIPNENIFLLLSQFYYEHFYKILFSVKNVVFVQAGPLSLRNLEKLDSEFYTDCQNIENRLIVSGFASQDSGIPIKGANAMNLLTDYKRGPWNCTDLYINFGTSSKRPYEPGPYPSMFTTEGIGVSPAAWRSNSEAAPLALSHLIYLKNSGIIQGVGSEFVSNLKSYLQGKLIDPYRYRQFEFFRLGRL